MDLRPCAEFLVNLFDAQAGGMLRHESKKALRYFVEFCGWSLLCPATLDGNELDVRRIGGRPVQRCLEGVDRSAPGELGDLSDEVVDRSIQVGLDGFHFSPTIRTHVAVQHLENRR